MFNNNPTAAQIEANYEAFKKSVRYNYCMYQHYKQRYKEVRQSWNFLRTAFVWKKMAHYRIAYYDAKLNELLTDLNYKANVSIKRA